MSDFKRYSTEAVAAYNFADPYRQSSVLHQAAEQQIGVAENEQQFSALHIDQGGGPTFVRLNSLFGNTATLDQQYIAVQYAAAFPDRSYLSIDLPAHGASDPLTASQKKEIRGAEGSLASIAKAQIEAALDIAPGLDDVVLSGEAIGQVMAVEFAAEAAAKGIKVRRLFGFDPLGFEDRTPFALAAGYLKGAQNSRKQRRTEPELEGERRLEEAYSTVFAAQMSEIVPTTHVSRAQHAKLLARERTVMRLMLQKSPVTRAVGARALQQALDTQPQMEAHLVFAGQSPVGRYTDQAREILATLWRGSGGRVHLDHWSDDNQDIGLARHQPRLIKYIADRLR